MGFAQAALAAVLTQWDGDVAQATGHLEVALALAQEIGLPGGAWPIWGELGRLYGEQDEEKGAGSLSRSGNHHSPFGGDD